MMWVWSHRPQFLHLGLFAVAYVLGCGFAQSLAIVPGTGISIWPPAGLFIATLVLAPMPSWPWWVVAGCIAELLSNAAWFHSPLPAAFLIYAGNALEAVVGAWLVNRICGRTVRLETLQEVLAFVVLGAGVAPAVSATVGSATLAWFGIQSQSFTTAWPLWWIGDATGTLLVAPPALVVFQNWRGKAQLSAAQWIEAGVLGLIFLGAAALSLSNYYLPFAYIIMPPLLWAAVRFEFKGVAVTLTLLALITVVFAMSGASQFAGDPQSQKQKQVMLQLFLAISAFSALIVAAISRQYQQALLTLRESERRLQQLVDAVPALVFSTMPDGRPSYVSRRFTEVTGATLADITAPDGTPAMATVHPDDKAAVAQAFSRSVETGAPYFARYRQRRRDGSYRWTEGRAEPLRDDAGAILQWYGVSVDVHDLVTAEEALRRSERKLQQMVDAVPVRIWSATSASGPVHFNKRYQDYLRSVVPGFEALEAPRIETFVQELVHREDAPEVQRTLRNCFDAGRAAVMRFRWREKDGVYRWAESRVEPRHDQDGAIVEWYGVSLDIDDEVRAQEALRQASERLAQASQAASLAELSASIAHEVNQPLAAIVANSHACQRWLSAEPPNVARAQVTAERIIRDANSAADVVSRIRALFRQSVEPRNSAALAGVVVEVRNLMAEEAARRRVRIDVEIESNLPLVALDRVQVQQVLINLIRNGMEAMDPVAGERILGVRVYRMDDVIQTEISDRGRGIEFPDKIFEPFFTTKAHGMGMGLAICRSIIESHGGRLWAQNNEPHGATFIFTLPVEVKAAA